MTETERTQLEAMLIAYFPTTPEATARAWILGVRERRVDDVAKAIQAMSKATAFASAHALEEQVTAIVAVRARESAEVATTKLLAAYASAPGDLVANRAKFARIADAMRRHATAEEIEAIALDGVKR